MNAPTVTKAAQAAAIAKYWADKAREIRAIETWLKLGVTI